MYTTASQPNLYHQPGRSPNAQAFYQSTPQSLPGISPQYSSPQSANMPTYYIDDRRGRRSSSHSRPTAQPVVYTSSTGHHQYPSSRDYAYGDPSGRHRRSSSVGHGGHYANYYPSTSRSHRSSSHSRSPRDYGVSSSSGHRRSHSQSRSPRHYEVPHHSSHRHSSSGHHAGVAYSDPGLHHSSSHRRHNSTSESLGDRFRRWFGSGHLGHQSHSRPSEYVDARTGRPCDRSGRPIYRV